jgi:integrin beta 2
LHCKFSGKCIPKEWVCDGMPDCGLISKFNLLDISDESGNSNCTKQCPTNKIACSNGECLHISKFCDGHMDCSNDEDGYCNDKSVCKNLKCQYDCKPTPQGPKCYCPQNQEIVNGTKCIVQKTCTDDNEDGEICDQLCTSIKGRNKCTCANGYERINHKCFGVNCE